LPVFTTILNAEGKVNRIGFSTSDLSNRAREYVATELFKRLENFKKHTEAFSVDKRAQRNDLLDLESSRT